MMTISQPTILDQHFALRPFVRFHHRAQSRQATPYQLLLRATEQIMAGRPTGARHTLTELVATVNKDPQALQYQLFARGLAQHLTTKSSQQTNLYLADVPVPQIELFNLLGQHVPFVTLSTNIANQWLANFCRDQAEVWLIDIGMGTGRQLVALLEQLHREQQMPTHLHIIGIEPAQESLTIGASLLAATAQRLGISLDIHPICRTAEDLSADEWQAIRVQARAPLINASFALHHIRDTEGQDTLDLDRRAQLLRQLQTLTPRALILAEPNADHVERNLLQRLQNCWHHFGTVFHVIDQLPITQQEKAALKVNFFGREIDDILRPEEALRTERHEPVAHWLQRLSACGYQTHYPMPTIKTQPPVQVQYHDGYVGLDCGAETVISLICATPIEA